MGNIKMIGYIGHADEHLIINVRTDTTLDQSQKAKRMVIMWEECYINSLFSLSGAEKFRFFAAGLLN